MGLRTLFVDDVQWTIWDVYPAATELLAASGDGGLQDGWLCFETATEKRRLVPVPQGWEDWTDERLLLALRAASVVPRRQALPETPA